MVARVNLVEPPPFLERQIAEPGVLDEEIAAAGREQVALHRFPGGERGPEMGFGGVAVDPGRGRRALGRPEAWGETARERR